MRKLSVAILSVVGLVGAATSASALAYDTRLDPVALIAHPLTSRDSCAATYDYVFGTNGKGAEDVILSHSCLPDPCDDANAPALARLLGIDIRPSDWAFYKARFGAMCGLESSDDMVARSESLPFGVSPILGDNGPLLTPGALVPGANALIAATDPTPSSSPDPTTVASGVTPTQPTVIPTPTPFPWVVPTTGGGSGSSGGSGSGGSGSGGSGGSGSGGSGSGGSGSGGSGNGGSGNGGSGGNGNSGNANNGLTDPNVVPLPSGGLLLIGALACAGLARRRES